MRIKKLPPVLVVVRSPRFALLLPIQTIAHNSPIKLQKLDPAGALQTQCKDEKYIRGDILFTMLRKTCPEKAIAVSDGNLLPPRLLKILSLAKLLGLGLNRTPNFFFWQTRWLAHIKGCLNVLLQDSPLVRLVEKPDSIDLGLREANRNHRVGHPFALINNAIRKSCHVDLQFLLQHPDICISLSLSSSRLGVGSDAMLRVLARWQTIEKSLVPSPDFAAKLSRLLHIVIASCTHFRAQSRNEYVLGGNVDATLPRSSDGLAKTVGNWVCRRSRSKKKVQSASEWPAKEWHPLRIACVAVGARPQQHGPSHTTRCCKVHP